MLSPEQELFIELKKEVSATFRKAFPSSPVNIEDWKGQDIVNFQEELIQKVQGRISEKWFYTHIKGTQEKLPRIDMLNLLSEYAGYRGWSDFTSRKGKKTGPQQDITTEKTLPPVDRQEGTALFTGEQVKKPGKKIKWLIGGGVMMAAVAVAIFMAYRPVTRTYQCCFVDTDGRALVPNARVEVRVLSYNESPVLMETDTSGCIRLTTTEDKIRFVVTSPYYMPDTVTRMLAGEPVSERVKLKTNDYALMIHYFSTSKVKDWKKRRLQLDDMIADNAKIFQVYDDNRGMELYNKEEFVNKLTMPLKSLKNIEIIETRYKDSRITEMKFRQREE